MKKVKGVLLFVILFAICLSGCTGYDNEKIKALDYSSGENWVLKTDHTDSEYDLIYFYGTCVSEPDHDNGVGEVSEDMKKSAENSYLVNGKQLSSCGVNAKKANVYMPLYRQIALEYILKNCKRLEDLPENIAAKEPGADLCAFMDYYFENINKDAKKPFVLAGHSQGASAVQHLIENYFIGGGHKEYLKNMVAAYSTGYGVSRKWFDGLDRMKNGRELIHFARGAGDCNCLLSWNVEGPGRKGKSIFLAGEEDETLVINPLNWKRDETYAGIRLNKGVLVKGDKGLFISHRRADLSDAQIDAERGSVICTTHDEYISSELFGKASGGKSLHRYDARGYYVNMKKNLKVRLKHLYISRFGSE